MWGRKDSNAQVQRYFVPKAWAKRKGGRRVTEAEEKEVKEPGAFR